MLLRLFKPDSTSRQAHGLYLAVVAQARQRAFFAALEVPDSLDGRFETIALHAFLVLHRLKAEGAARAALGQALFDTMFADMDRNLREMGAGDLGVGRRVKDMAAAFYGRVGAYDEGLAEGDETLAAALRRNLFGTIPGPSATALRALCVYIRASVAELARQDVRDVGGARLAWGDLPPVP
ncbi:MAG: ubiquinol-cytochrome C chaperone family protein [Pseudomonadota bacterium]